MLRSLPAINAENCTLDEAYSWLMMLYGLADASSELAVIEDFTSISLSDELKRHKRNKLIAWRIYSSKGRLDLGYNAARENFLRMKETFLFALKEYRKDQAYMYWSKCCILSKNNPSLFWKHLRFGKVTSNNVNGPKLREIAQFFENFLPTLGNSTKH